MNLASQLAAINVLTDQNFKPFFFFSPKREIRTRSLIRAWLLGSLLPRLADATCSWQLKQTTALHPLLYTQIETTFLTR